MYKKPVILILALLLPAAIFVFLKKFGKNEFTVEPLFQEGEVVAMNCNMEYKTPYTVADTVLTSFDWKMEDAVTVIVFADSSGKKLHEQQTQIGRILKELSSDKVRVIMTSSRNNELSVEDGRFQFIQMDSTSLYFSRACVFLLTEVRDAVIIDSERRIVGQYSLVNREEADRLILEGKILLRLY